jgi:putative component of membrane protein insertase Oxa1/YidC/SpoIIIJ protein YidD
VRAALPLAGTLLAAACAGPRNAGQGAIDLYQEHLGAQWAFHCDFEPSCSRFAEEAVDAHGLLPGVLMTADRLMRDHPYGVDRYPRDRRGHVLDPVPGAVVARELLPGAPLFLTLVGTQAPREPEGPHPVRSDQEHAAAHLELAERLDREERYAWAALEYFRALELDPVGEGHDLARRRAAVCLSRIGRHEEALATIEPLAAADRDLLRSWLEREAGRLDDAVASAAPQGREGRLLAGLYSLEADEPERARGFFLELPPPQQELLLEQTERFEELPSRSAPAAGIFSALLPGSGQIYAGRTADGIMAFLVNGTLIGGALVAAHNEEDVTAITLGVVAVGFYAGNIYGAVNAAHLYNEERRAAFLTGTRGLLRDRRAALGLVPTRDGGALALYLRF